MYRSTVAETGTQQADRGNSERGLVKIKRGEGERLKERVEVISIIYGMRMTRIPTAVPLPAQLSISITYYFG